MKSPDTVRPSTVNRKVFDTLLCLSSSIIINYIVAALTYVKRPVCFVFVYFDTRPLISYRSAPSQKYIVSLVLDRASDVHSDISPIPPLILQGLEKCEIRFSTPVAFDELWFRNGAKYRNFKYKAGALIANLSYNLPLFLYGVKSTEFDPILNFK